MGKKSQKHQETINKLTELLTKIKGINTPELFNSLRKEYFAIDGADKKYVPIVVRLAKKIDEQFETKFKEIFPEQPSASDEVSDSNVDTLSADQNTEKKVPPASVEQTGDIDDTNATDAPALIEFLDSSSNEDQPLSDDNSKNLRNPIRTTKINPYLAQLQLKVKELETRGEHVASTALKQIHSTINLKHQAYCEGEINCEQFKKAVNDALNPESEDVKEVVKHRGIKQILANIATAVAGLFVFYGISAIRKHSFTLFPVNTDSANQLADLKAAVDTLDENEESLSVHLT